MTGPKEVEWDPGISRKFYIRATHSLKKVDWFFFSSFIAREFKIIDTVYASTPFIFPSHLIRDPRKNWLLKIK